MPNVWSMCAVCAIFIVQFNLPVGCWPLMVGAHNLRLILQIEMQTDATGVVDTRYAYMGMSCATPDKILHSTMQDNTKQLFQLPYGQHPVHCIALLYCTLGTRRPKLAIWFAPWLQGMVWWFMLALRYITLHYVGIAIQGNCCESHWCMTEPCYHQDGQSVEVDYAEWLLSYDMRHSFLLPASM